MSRNARPAPEGKLTVMEAAAQLGVTRQAIHRRIQRGSMNAEKDQRGRFLIPEEAVS